MAKRHEWEAQWGRIASLLERCRRSVGLSLAEAQQLCDAAPDGMLPRAFVQSVVSQALQRRAEQWQLSVRHGLDNLVFSADALAWSDVGWEEAAGVFGVDGDGRWMDAATVVRSDDVDTGRVTGAWPLCWLAEGLPPTDSVVYDVWSDFRDVGRSEFRRVRQGTVLSDVFLDGRGLNAQEYSSQHELWCDGTDREWESRPRIHDN